MADPRSILESSPPEGAAQAAPDFVAVAEIVGVFGLKGEVKANLQTEFPDRFRRLAQVWIDGRPVDLESSRLHRGQVLLKLRGVDGPEAAEKYRGKLVEVPLDQAIKLPRGRFWIFQIVGLDVATADGEQLGTVADVLTTGANDVYVVRGDAGEILIPAIKQVIKQIDLGERRITVDLLPGLR